MHASRRNLLLKGLKVFDLVLMVASFLLASYLVLLSVGNLTFGEFLSMRIKVLNFILFLLLIYFWHVVLNLFGLYKSRRMLGWGADVVDTFSATTLGAFLIAAASVAFHIHMVTVTFVLVFWFIVTLATVAGRVLLRRTLIVFRRRGRNLRHVLIIGTNSRAVEFARKIETMPELGYSISGFVDQDWEQLEEFKKKGYSVVCDLDDIADFLRHNVVDEVLITLPIRSLHVPAAKIASLCEEHGIIVRVLSDIFELKQARVRADELDGSSLITLSLGNQEGWPAALKRTLDVALSFSLLCLLAPVLIIVATLIKLTSPGPILFTQDRMGLYKRRFKIYKFRTMVTDAEQKMKQIEHLNEVSGPVFKIKNDPRITPIGKFLRKTSIDELPQLFNVLAGDMSLVGPRPLPVRDYEGFTQDWTRRRLSVKPGITCLWQITGRSTIQFEKWMQLDLQYIDEWSLWLDFRILFQTIPAVLRGSGAA